MLLQVDLAGIDLALAVTLLFLKFFQRGLEFGSVAKAGASAHLLEKENVHISSLPEIPNRPAARPRSPPQVQRHDPHDGPTGRREVRFRDDLLPVNDR